MSSPLELQVRRSLGSGAPAPIVAIAHHVRRLHKNVLAVLAYGAAVRDALPTETLIDLYVLTADHAGVTANPLSRLACALVPPNVYFAEQVVDGHTYRTKYAVLPLPQMRAKVGLDVSNPYFWARFAQPACLIWCKDASVGSQVADIVSSACATAFANATGTSPTAPALEQWTGLFRETYRTELRPEREGRAAAIVEAHAHYFESLSAALRDTPPVYPSWAARRLVGKALSVLRLAKAAFTFQGGADYIAWKIKRHSGVEIEVTEFHRRHPLVAGLLLLPQMLRRGAVR